MIEDWRFPWYLEMRTCNAFIPWLPYGTPGMQRVNFFKEYVLSLSVNSFIEITHYLFNLFAESFYLKKRVKSN